MRRAVRSERGQALVEAALLLPILCVLAMGAIDFGRAYYTYTELANAAREGAICASLRTLCPGGAGAAATAEVGTSLPGGVTTAVTGGASPGSSVTVTVRHDFQAITTAVLGTRPVPTRPSATTVVQ